MIVYPTLRISRNKTERLSRRDLIVTADGFAGVFFGGHLHYIKPDGEIVLSDFPTRQTGFVLAKNFQGQLAHVFTSNSLKYEKIFLPNDEDLFELASMGIDAAVICLRIRSRSNNNTENIYNRAISLRPRYKMLKALTYSEAGEYFLKAQLLDPVLAKIDIKHFAQPFGSGHFHANIEKSNSFTASNYLNDSVQSLSLPQTITYKTAQKYIVKNIFLQNSIKQEKADLFMEKDRLNFRELSRNSEPFETISQELANMYPSWTSKTKKRLRSMAEEVVYRVCSNKELTESYDEKVLLNHAQNLSVFCALQFCRDNNEKRRIKNLFNAGARKLGQLINLP